MNPREDRRIRVRVPDQAGFPAAGHRPGLSTQMISRRYCLALACAAWVGPAVSAEAVRQPWRGKPLKPQLQLPLQTGGGGTWSLAEQKGSALLLNFWASWCEPCRTEMPSLERLAGRFETQGLQVLAINYREPEASVQRFIDSTGLRLPVLRDAGEGARLLGVHIFPSTVAISRTGGVLFTVVGACDWGSAAAERWVAALL